MTIKNRPIFPVWMCKDDFMRYISKLAVMTRKNKQEKTVKMTIFVKRKIL